MKKDNLTYSFLSLRDKLHRSALSFLKNEDEAQDALQETFLRLWKNGRIDSDLEARNKLFTVLRNICIDKLRRPRTEPLNESIIENYSVIPDSVDDIRHIEAIISTGLTDIQRQIYMLVAHDGMEYEEIASKLNMTVEAVRMNMCRARKKIRDNYLKLN